MDERQTKGDENSEDIIELLENTTLSPDDRCALLRHLSTRIFRSSLSKRSRLLLLMYFDVLVSNQGDAVYLDVVNVLLSHARNYAKQCGSKSIDSCALLCLQTCFMLLRRMGAEKLSSSDCLRGWSEATGLLFCCLCSSPRPRLLQRCRRRAKHLAKQPKLGLAVFDLLTADASPSGLCLPALLAAGGLQLDGPRQTRLAEVMCQQLLSGKVSPPAYLVTCSSMAVKLLSADDWHKVLVPSMARSLLRSPEVVLQAASSLLHNCTLDLSSCSEELVRSLQPLLTSEEASVGALQALSGVASRIGDGAAFVKLCDSLCATLKTAPAKQKQAVLLALGQLSSAAHAPPGALLSALKTSLAGDALEAVSLSALVALKQWAAKTVDDEQRKEVVAMLTSALASKSAAIKSQAVDCLRVFPRPPAALVSEVLRLVERGSPPESLQAALLLTDNEKLWPMLKAPAFASDKWIASAPADVLKHLPAVCAQAVAFLPDAEWPIRALAAMLVHPDGQVRRASVSSLRGLLGGLSVKHVLKEILAQLARGNALSAVGPVLLEMARALRGSREAALLLVHAALLAHNPDAGSPQLWRHMVRRAGTSLDQLVEDNADELIGQALGQADSKSRLLLLATLFSCASPSLPALFATRWTALWRATGFSALSEEECGVFCTPEGQLYNQTALRRAAESSARNVKRESKAYSFREQMEAEQLRKELSGDKDLKELLHKELQREAELRARIRLVDDRLCSLVRLLEAAGQPALLQQVPMLASMLWKDVDHVVAAPRARDALAVLHCVAFSRREAMLVLRATLKRLHPACPMPHEWQGQGDGIGMMLDTLHTPDQEQVDARLSLLFPLLRTLLTESAPALSALDLLLSHLDARFPPADQRPVSLSVILDLLLHLVRSEHLQGPATSALSRLASRLTTASPQDHLAAAFSSDSVPVRRAVAVALAQVDAVDRSNMARACLLVAARDHEVRAGAHETPDACLLDCTLEHFCLCPVDAVSRAGAEAVCTLLADADSVRGLLPTLRHVLDTSRTYSPEERDRFGRLAKHETPDLWWRRRGVAWLLDKMAAVAKKVDPTPVLLMCVEGGFEDRNETVRAAMVTAAVQWLDSDAVQGQLTQLLALLEKHLKGDNASDQLRLGCVACLGSLAGHLPADDERVRAALAQLFTALLTVNDVRVQESMATVAPRLMASLDDKKLDQELKRFEELVYNGDNPLHKRRGAALAVAAAVKGKGVALLKNAAISQRITDALDDRKRSARRQGALLLVRALHLLLGRLLEPYVVSWASSLMHCFSDPTREVRDAADECTRTLMAQLSPHGVKLTLPKLLEALVKEDSWRAKKAAVDMLSAMAFLAPRQLSECLPSLVPCLLDTLADAHPGVAGAAADALKRIAAVARAPDLQPLLPALLDALQQPDKTASALQGLMSTRLSQTLDAAALALLLPVLQRALADRSAETRKTAAQALAAVAGLTEARDLQAYLERLWTPLSGCLQDPAPEVRYASARSLRAMCACLGEAECRSILEWLKNKLCAEGVPVDRAGAAQGLAEMMAAVGPDKLITLVPSVVSAAGNANLPWTVRDGYLQLLVYMPAAFGATFADYLDASLAPILRGLADENECVRESAMLAAQRIIVLFADKAVQLLLPALEKGLVDSDNWRIRAASVQLLGDLLFRLAGVSGRGTTEAADEADTATPELSLEKLSDSLGPQRRDRIMAGLFIARQDLAPHVRSSAGHTWKSLVANTARVLRELLPALFPVLLEMLAADKERQELAERTLDELQRRLGDRVLPELLPLAEKALGHPKTKRAALAALTHALSTSKEYALALADRLLPPITTALADPDVEVRAAAALCLDPLQRAVGPRVAEECAHKLLALLAVKPDDECALDGLRQLLSGRAKVMLPSLLPALTTSPVRANALLVLAEVCKDALQRHLARLAPALVDAVRAKPDDVALCAQVLVLACGDEPRSGSQELLRVARPEAVTLLAAFLQRARPLDDIASELLPPLVHLLANEQQQAQEGAWEAIKALLAALSPPQLPPLATTLRHSLRNARAPLPGLCLLKRGVGCLLPALREALMNGDAEAREAAAAALGEAVRLSSPEALRPDVLNLTGPLIRALGDRLSPRARAAVLATLSSLLDRLGPALKPFLPQLQTSLLKAAIDPARNVRLQAAAALRGLTGLHPRPESLAAELCNALKSSTDAAIKHTVLWALRGAIEAAGDRLPAAARNTVSEVLKAALADADQDVTTMAAACVGAMAARADEDFLRNNILMLCDTSPDTPSSLAALAILIKDAPQRALAAGGDTLTQTLTSSIATSAWAVRALGFLLLAVDDDRLLALLAKQVSNTQDHVAIVAAGFVGPLARKAAADSSRKALVPALVNGTKERNQHVRAKCEMALVDLLALRGGDDTLQLVLPILDSGMKDSLKECVDKTLRRRAKDKQDQQDTLDPSVLSE